MDRVARNVYVAFLDEKGRVLCMCKTIICDKWNILGLGHRKLGEQVDLTFLQLIDKENGFCYQRVARAWRRIWHHSTQGTLRMLIPAQTEWVVVAGHWTALVQMTHMEVNTILDLL
jgi:hypothetical protein